MDALFTDAEQKQLTDKLVKMWLDDLRHLSYDDISSRLKQLWEEKDDLGLTKMAGGGTSSTGVPQRPPTTCIPTEPFVVGRDEDKARILEMVLMDEPGVGVIPIVGMGGIGKTTLAREVFNDKAVEDFKPRAWVCVYEDFDILRILKSILESILAHLVI